MKTNLLLQRLNAGKKVSGVLREANETLTRRYRDVKSGVTVAQQWLKYAAAIFMLFTLAIGNVWGQGTETFEGLTNATNYASRSWTGVNGETWAAENARTDNKITDNRGLTFAASGTRTITMVLTTAQKNAGIGTLSFNYKHPFSDSGKSNTVTLAVNGSDYSTSSLSCSSSAQSTSITVDAIPNSASLTVTISGNARLCVDDFSWTACSTCGSTPTHTLSYAIVGEGEVDLSATTVAEGGTATAEATPDDGYQFTSWSISGAGASLSSTTDNPTTITMGTADAEVTATFTALTAANITLSEDGSTRTVSGYYVGDTYTLPSTLVTECTGNVLVGWSTVTISTPGSKPTSNYYDKGATITLSASQTFYAVYATASVGSSSSGSAKLVSSSSSSHYSSGDIVGELGTNKATWTADAFTMEQNKNNSGTAVSLNYDEIRVYASHSLVFTPASGTTITSIVVAANSDAYATALGGGSIANCTKEVDGSTVTITPTDGTAAITLVNTAQSRLNSITVNYTTGGSVTYSNYTTSCIPPSQCETPTFSPVAGTYTAAQTVTISSTTTGSTIYYTTDGSTPTTSSTSGTAGAASATVTVSTSQTLKAIAVKDGMTNSEVGTAEYVIQCVAPTFSPAAGTYCGEQTVTLTCTTDGATIRYTTDGTDPTESSTVYSSAITVSSTTTIKAKAFKTGLAASSVASATYTIATLTTMDAIFTAATAAGSTATEVCITFNNWVVSGVSTNGKNVYVTDGTKGFIIFNSGAGMGFAAGDILSGTANCKVQLYNGAAEITTLNSSTEGLSVTTGGTVTPIVVDATAIGNLTGVNTGSVVTTTGVCSESDSKYYINGAQIYNQLLDPYTNPTPDETYTVVGVYVQYKTTHEILPLTLTLVNTCAVDPTINDPTIPTSFTLTSLTGAVSVNGTVDEGTGCSWADMGLVWGATANPTTSNNKKVIDNGTPGHTKSFANNVQPTGSTTPTAWVVGTTYYVRIYGQNSKDGATYHYSTNDASFTLRSIDFEENGGSTVNMIYCNSGGHATQPTDPTKDGYTFGGWYKESTLTTPVDWANDVVSANTTYYAKWTALPTYTVTLKDDDTELEQLTPGASITLPSREGCSGYTFAGWTKSWTEAQTSWTTTAPTIIPAGSYTPTANENLYPVYTKTESSGTKGYTVTTTLTQGKIYVFGAVKAAASASLANNTAFGAVAFTNTYNNTTGGTWGARVDLTPNSSGVLTGTDTTNLTSACKWVLENIEGGNYTFKNGSNYLCLGTSAGSTSSAQCGIATTAGNFYLEDVNSTCKDAFLCHPTSISTNVMLYNTSSGYRMYASRTYSNTMSPYVRFYEYSPGSSTTSYISVPNCCTAPATALSITSANTVVAGNTLSLTTTGGNGETVTWSVVNGTGSATVSGSTLTAVSAGTVTVTAAQDDGATECGAEVTQTVTIYSSTKYTVTLKDDDTQLTQAAGGAAVDLPWRTGCKGFTFVGWTNSWGAAQTTWTTTAPTIISAGSYIPTANENLYPVYTKSEGEEEATVGAIMLSENFSDFNADDQPTEPGATSVTYDAGITYTCSSANTKIYTSGGPTGGSGNNLLVAKDGGSFVITDIPTGGAKALTFRCLHNNSLTITSTNANVVLGSRTGSGTEYIYTLTVNNNATSFGLNFSNTYSNNVRLDDISIVVATSGRVTSYISVPNCQIFENDKTIFIQAESASAWDASACVKAWFNNSGAGGSAQTTYWLFDASAPDAGKKLFATIIPASGDVNQVTLQRFASNCTDFWNNNGTLTGSSATSNTFRSTGSGTNNIFWNATGVTLMLKGSPDSWTNPLGIFTDQGGGIWTASYNNYTPTGTSAAFKIETNYNGWIGDTGSNNNATLSDMIVGSTYNVTATLDITDHSLVITKEFVKGTVHFDMQGHGTQIADLTDVAAGHVISAPSPEPTATGYLFRGWYTNAACTAGNEWDFAHDRVSETMTLYAKWVNDKFTVTWVANGTTLGTTPNVPNGETTSTWSATPEALASNCDGTKVFVGWTAIADYEHATNAPDDIFTGTTPAITDDITFYAVFGLANGTKTYAFEITADDFNTTSYAANNNEKTTVATATDLSGAQMNVRWTSYDVYRTSDMQWRKKDGSKGGYIYNSTNLGTVNSVNITSTAGTFETFYGTSKQPTSGAQGSGNGYFQTLVTDDATGHTSKVRVEFTAPYYLGYSTTCVAPTKCMTPMFDPGEGTYSTTQSVSIYSTDGATIYYTTDGSDPTTSGTRSTYSSAISVSTDMTIKAVAVGCTTNSDVATATYHVRCAAPTFSPEPGTYSSSQSVTLTAAEGATIYITLDGSTPTTSSLVYEGAIDVNETMVIKAIAVITGMAPSEVAVGKYIIADCNWYESFASCSGAGGNDGRWNGLSGSGGVVADHAGWTIDNGEYGGNQCVKAGTSSANGHIYTPNISVTNNIQYKLTFNVAPWDNGTAKFDIVTGGELLDGTTTWTAAANMTASEWNKYEVYIHTTATTVQIKFYSTGKRFWLNDVCLKGLGDVKYHVTYEGNGSTGGTVPEDNTEYGNNDEVTVKGNTGSLVKDGYTFAGWNTEADGSGTDYAAGATFNILHDVTLYAKWTIEAYTINWKVTDPSHGGYKEWTAGDPATSATYGTQPASIPTAPTSGDCDGSKVFVGWSATAVPTATDTRPKDLFTSKYAAPVITANTTFYAVFATPAAASTQFDLYSGALTEGEYLITYNNKAMKAAVTTNRLNYEDVTVTADKVSTNEPTLVWYLYQDGGYWRIYNTTAGYVAATNVKNQAVIILDGSDNKAKWTATGSATYEFENKDRAESSSNPNNKWLRENGTYGFACYATGTGGALTLYKRNAAYTGYATTCESPVHPYLIAEPTMLDFGNVAVGATVPAQTVTLSGDNLENVTITVTAPNAGFTVSPTTIPVNGTLSATTITVTPVTTVAGTFNGNLVITYTDSNPAESITINIPLILKVSPLYTVTLHDLNTDEGTEQISTLKQTTPGSAVILPTTSPSSVCMINGWVFAGWVEGSALSATSVRPTLKLAEAYTPTADVDLYAVYMHRTNCTNTTDIITRSVTGAEDNDTYAEWEEVTVTSAAKYAGSTAGGNDAIQFRSTDESGIITTTSGGVVSQISIEWNAATVKGRVLQVYGKKTAYGTTSELYDPANRGILLGTATKGTDLTTVTLTIDADFEYIGIRSKDDLAYASTISVVWSNNCTRTWDSNPSCNPCTAKPTLNAATVASYATTTATVNCSGITNITGEGGTAECVITSYGYCWGISETPNLTDNSHEMGTSYTTLNTSFGEYTITGLTPGVKYCVRPYATNGLGTAYGAAECFTTTLVDHISFEVPNGVDAPQAVTLGESLPHAGVPQDCGNCWVFVGWTLESTWDAATLPSPLYKAGYSATSQGLSGTHKLYAVYKRDFYRMLTYPSELALDDGGAQTVFDDNYYVLTLYTGEETGEWAMDAVLDNNNRNATTTNIDDILHLEYGNYSIFNPDPKDVWHLEGLTKTGTGEGSSATTKIYNLVEGGQKKYIRLAGSGQQVITTNTTDGNLNLSVTSNNEAGLAASFNIYRTSGRYNYYLARGTANGSYGFQCSTSAPSYSAYVYKRKSLEYKTIPECPKYTVTWKVNGATVRTDYVSRCEGVPKPPAPPAVSPLDECGANGFLGWSIHKVGHLGSEYAPSDVFKDKEDAPELQGNVTFYAIYGYPAGYEYIGDKAVLAHGETYLFVNRKTQGSGKAMDASNLVLQNGSSNRTAPGVTVQVGTNAIIAGEFENLEFYCDQRKVNNSNLRVVSDASRTKYLHINDKGVGYKVNAARSHYTTKNLLYGWNDGQTSVRYAYWNGSAFASSTYNKNVYAFRKIYKNFKTTCYEEWPAVAVEWGQNKLIIDMDTTAAAVAKAAKYDVQIGSLHSSKMDVVQTKTSYNGNASPRTLTIDGSSKFDFTTYPGDVLIVNWYDSNNEKTAFSHIYIPSLVASNTTLTEDKDELHVLPGAMLTVNKPHEIGQLEIYPGATVFITGATLKAEKFILRGGWSRVNETKYDVGRVDIHPSGSLNKSHAFMDWYLDYDLYYPIAVPFPVAIKDIVFKNEQFSPETTRSVIKMKYYDGDQRARTNQSSLGENWKDYSPLPTNLEPSKGYAFTAKRPSGRAFSIIRMPMSFTNAWTTNGEKGVVNGSQKNVVEITKYEYAGTIWKALGWNFVANPYLALYNGNYLTGNLEQQEGGTVRYATIPTIDFQDYYQVDITQADLAPGSGFFVQAGGSAGQIQNIIFASDGRKHMPARILDGTMDDQDAYIRLEHANANDQMGIIVGEDYTEEYEINADLVKMMSPTDNSLKSYLHYNNMDLAYVALNPELAKEWIPVIVRVPESGTYTYTLKESSSVPALEAVWLWDALTGTRTNLLTDDYTFQVIGAGTITGRFSINAIVRPYSIETEIGNLINDDDKYVKFIYQNHIYIRYKGVIYDATGKVVELPNE